MKQICLPSGTDFEAWRETARRACAAGLAPHEIVWAVGGPEIETEWDPLKEPAEPVRASRAFVEMGRRAICHRDPARFHRLYRLLWRQQAEPGLTERADDPDLGWLRATDWEVRHDLDRLLRNARFRPVAHAGGAILLAEWVPTHQVLGLAGPPLRERLAGEDWDLITPEARLSCRDGALSLKPRGRPARATAPPPARPARPRPSPRSRQSGASLPARDSTAPLLL